MYAHRSPQSRLCAIRCLYWAGFFAQCFFRFGVSRRGSGPLAFPHRGADSRHRECTAGSGPPRRSRRWEQHRHEDRASRDGERSRGRTTLPGGHWWRGRSSPLARASGGGPCLLRRAKRAVVLDVRMPLPFCRCCAVRWRLFGRSFKLGSTFVTLRLVERVWCCDRRRQHRISIEVSSVRDHVRVLSRVRMPPSDSVRHRDAAREVWVCESDSYRIEYRIGWIRTGVADRVPGSESYRVGVHNLPAHRTAWLERQSNHHGPSRARSVAVDDGSFLFVLHEICPFRRDSRIAIACASPLCARWII